MRAVVIAALATLPSCAWANPENRPVWNRFERNLVPDDDGWFYATLPVTVPLGLGAVVVDTLVAHPLQVVDDAYEDAAELWDGRTFDFDDAYYTEVLLVPFRLVGTPLVFAGSFAGRSLFDIPSRTTMERRQSKPPQQHQPERNRRAEFVNWLEGLPDRRWQSSPPEPGEWCAEFAAPIRAALRGDAGTRRRLHVGMLSSGYARFGEYDAAVGLRDEDPVVRYATLESFPMEQLTDALTAALEQDPVESIRLLLQERMR